MFGTSKMETPKNSPYATRADFCRIFETSMNRLYLLSFLLTGDEETAEQCFVGGLHMAQQGNPVFREWAESWARRAIVLNALRMVRPRFTSEIAPVPLGRVQAAGELPEITQIRELPPFERFAFVMSVLEGYSDHECSLHLHYTVSEVREARTKALERLGRSAELRRKLVDIASGQGALEHYSGAEHELATGHDLAASA